MNSSKHGHISDDLVYCIDSNYYELMRYTTMSGGGCGQLNTYPLASGFVMRFKDTLILHNVKAGFNTKVKVTDTTLRVVQGFEWFKEIVFRGYGNEWRKDKWRDSIAVRYDNDYLKRSTTIDSLLFSAGKQQDSITRYAFEEGIYSESYTGVVLSPEDSTTLHVDFHGSSYTYKLGASLMSRGQWERVGNYIVFKDETLNAYFITELVGDNRFRTDIFPLAHFPIVFALYKRGR
ncbi:MAG: hypothetical protein H6550_11015 [Chitinophagales bacterium]|nr:hypothetical protein [Chitinophagales bacterium]